MESYRLVMLVIVCSSLFASSFAAWCINGLLERVFPACEGCTLGKTLVIYYLIYFSIALPLGTLFAFVGLLVLNANNPKVDMNEGSIKILKCQVFLHIIGGTLFAYSCVRHSFLFEEYYGIQKQASGAADCKCDGRDMNNGSGAQNNHEIILANKVFSKFALISFGIILCVMMFDLMQII